ARQSGPAAHPPDGGPRGRPRYSPTAIGPVRCNAQEAGAAQPLARQDRRKVRCGRGLARRRGEAEKEVGRGGRAEGLRSAAGAVQNACMSKLVHRVHRGFTIVELMIVVGIIGILASIAIPGYQKLTARSHRSEMLTAINKFKFFFKNSYDTAGSFATT